MWLATSRLRASSLAIALCVTAASCKPLAAPRVTATGPETMAPASSQAATLATPGHGGPAAARAAGALPSAPAPEVLSISLEDLGVLQASNKPPLLVDARMTVLYHLSHLPGAINLPAGRREAVFPQVREQIRAAQAAGRRVVFYCVDARCPDATRTALYVASQGGAGLLVYEGGIDEWKLAGLPLE